MGTYTTRQMMGLLQCSERHLRQLNARGRIPGRFKVGRLVRYKRKVVDAWLSGSHLRLTK